MEPGYSIIDNTNVGLLNQSSAYSYKLIHKDPDAIHGFCLNEVIILLINNLSLGHMSNVVLKIESSYLNSRNIFHLFQTRDL
jgi:hypothetical protein